ncbi:MAG: trimethylamine methyltransferase family protein [Planctomycetota bacterium]
MNELQNRATLRVLADEELRRIHAATLEILETTGVKFLCEEAIAVFRENGVPVDGEGVVRFSPEVVERAIRTSPSSFTRHNLDPKRPPVRWGGGDCYIGTGSTVAYIVDLEGRYRPGTEEDIACFARLSDAMEHLPIGNGMVWAQDIPKPVFHARYIEVLAKNNSKVVPAGDGLDCKTSRDLVRCSQAILGGVEEQKRKKTFTMTALPQQALLWSVEAAAVIEPAKAGLPNEICPMPLLGSMHPVTLAGGLVQMNVEMLSGIVLNQLVNPGAPVVWMSWPGMLDMAVASNVFGCPEQGLFSAASAQLARWYGIPSNIIVGQTDSKLPDQQAGYEKMMSVLLAALAGADEIALAGGLIDFGRIACYEQVVIDNEMAGYVQRALKGITVTSEKLAIDVIREVAHGGNYIAHEHTLNHFRDEQYFPTLSNRHMRQRWEAEGSKDLRELAVERARKILKEHRVHPLSKEQARDLEKEVGSIYKREGIPYKPYPYDG